MIGFYIQKYQPSFYTKIKNQFIIGKIITNQDNLIRSSFYTDDLLKKTKQNEFLNNKAFTNFFELASKTAYDNFLKRKDYFKNDFLEDNILNENQISFGRLDKKKIKNFVKLNFNPKHQEDNYQIFQVKYYEHYNIGVLHKSNKISNKIIIYNQGHGGSSYNHEYFLKLKSKYISEGYDILNLNMPLRGMNFLINKYTNLPINPYKNFLPSENINYPFLGTDDHQLFRYFYDKNFPNKKPLSVFLSGNYYLIKNILSLNNYSEIKIIGHSGGGLQAIYYMFLIPEISKGYISSGFFTKTHRLDNTGGDWEHYYSDFIINNSYFDLIYGSLMDENYKFSRELIFQFNNLDPSCCDYPYSKNFVNLVNNLGKNLNLNLSAHFIEKNFHKIHLNTLYEKF
tara:strand:- start:219 stop:1409 length:1191 start_codon:yes stop_codon:yes gene_type:complete